MITPRTKPDSPATPTQTEKSIDLRTAMDFFRWEVRPIVGFLENRDHPRLKTLQSLAGFAPISPLDIVSANLHGKASQAYQALLDHELLSNSAVKTYWEQLNQLEAFQGIKSFGERLQRQNGEQAMFVVWTDNRHAEKILSALAEIERVAPGFLHEAE